MAEIPFPGIVIVTGASRGIGQAIACAFTDAGAAVIGTSRHGQRSLGAGKPAAGELWMAYLDFEVPDTVDALFDELEARGCHIAVLVNNAGVGVFQLMDELTLQAWNQMLAVNLTGPFLCSKRALRMMRRSAGGRIINIGSIADNTPFGAGAAYCASKYGLRGLTEVLTEEGKSAGVFATLVSPGAVATDIWSGRPGFDSKDMLDPAAVARVVLHVASQPPGIRIDHVDVMPPRGIL